MELVSSLSTQIGAAQGLPYRRSVHKLLVMLVSNRRIVYGCNMLRLPQMLDCRYEAFRSGVEEMFRDRPVVFFTPYSCSLRLFRCVSRRFTEADKP
jgi:hypothetical protein